MGGFPEEEADGGGFDVDDWGRLEPFAGRVATLDDVQARRAVFALTETTDPRPLDMALPQPVIWWEDDGEQAAVRVAESRSPATEGPAASTALLEDASTLRRASPNTCCS